MAAAATRHVGRLRLTAPDREAVQRGAVLIEDALRTASVPGTMFGRRLFVRTLDLGVFSRRSSPSTLALRIEKALASAACSAVHALSSGAARAAAVYFQDEVEAAAALAERVAAGAAPGEWFWAKAVPGWSASLPPDEALRLCWRTVLASGPSPPPAASAAALVARLHELGRADAILEVLAPGDVAALLSTARLDHDPDPDSAVYDSTPSAEGAVPLLPARSQALLTRWASGWGVSDGRTFWLAALLLRTGMPALPLSPSPEAIIERVLRRALRSQAKPVARDSGRIARKGGEGVSEMRPPPDVGPETGTPRPDSIETAAPLHAPTRPDARVEVLGGPQGSSLEDPPVAASDAGELSLATPDVPVPTEISTPNFRPAAGPAMSANGGLLFLVRIFERLGITAFLRSHPHLIEADFGRRLLSFTALRLRIAPSDDLLRAIWDGDESFPDQPFPASFAAPSKWEPLSIAGPRRLARAAGDPGRRILFDGSGRLPLLQWNGCRSEAARSLAAVHGLRRRRPVEESAETILLRAWTEAARRWSRRAARSSLTFIVRRAARVAASRTHIDVAFRLAQADVRLRGAGLDVDPGWVPWLGKVVRFHYLEDEEFARGSNF